MLPQEVKNVLQRLESAGHRAYAVGGCVRDTLRRVAPHDYDITTSARPEEVLTLFAPHAIPTGLQHGTVTVRENHQSLEVTTFRADGVYSDHRRPDSVTFSDSLEEDLQRRDFTVNAMAMDLRGKVYDFHGGEADLRAGILRCVGEAETRFNEDALRILRGLRFAAVLGYTIEPQTAAAMERCAPLLRYIAAERICEEMTKLLCGDHAAEVLCQHVEVLRPVLPELGACVDFQTRMAGRESICCVWAHTLRVLEQVPGVPAMRWAALLYGIGKPFCYREEGHSSWGEFTGYYYGVARESEALAGQVLQRLRMDRKTRERVLLLIREQQWELKEPGMSSVLQALRELGAEALGQLVELRDAINWTQWPPDFHLKDDLQKVREWMAVIEGANLCFSLDRLTVNGDDLLSLGLRGEEIGRMLDALLTQVVELNLPNEKDTLMRWVKDAKK